MGERGEDVQQRTTGRNRTLVAAVSKPFSEGEFLKECVVETASLLCPQNKSKFENIRLSRKTGTRCIQLFDE